MYTRTMSVDSGKYETKAAMMASPGNIKHLSFKTQMSESVEKFCNDTGKSYSIEFEGNQYLLGEQARMQSFDRSKQSILHKIATYTAVSNMMKASGSNGDSINLAIGCPLSIYINKDARKHYKDYIAPSGGKISIKVNDEDHSFTILKSVVYPESSGVIYLNKERYENDLVGVIDIGGLNANCCIYDNLVPKSGSDAMFTLEMGGNILTSNIMTKLESEFETEIGTILYEKVMRDGFIKKNPEASAKRIAELKKAHVIDILTECKRHKWSTDNMDIVFTGGTAKLLKDEIQEVFPTAILDHLDNEASFKKADGFLKQMLIMCGQAVYL